MVGVRIGSGAGEDCNLIPIAAMIFFYLDKTNDRLNYQQKNRTKKTK